MCISRTCPSNSPQTEERLRQSRRTLCWPSCSGKTIIPAPQSLPAPVLDTSFSATIQFQWNKTSFLNQFQWNKTSFLCYSTLSCYDDKSHSYVRTKLRYSRTHLDLRTITGFRREQIHTYDTKQAVLLGLAKRKGGSSKSHTRRLHSLDREKSILARQEDDHEISTQKTKASRRRKKRKINTPNCSL